MYQEAPGFRPAPRASLAIKYIDCPAYPLSDTAHIALLVIADISLDYFSLGTVGGPDPASLG